MLIIQKGYVKHRGILFSPGQVLPELPKKEERRLLELGVCFEGDVPRLERAKEEKIPLDDCTTGSENVENSQNEGDSVNLNFDPDENIKTNPKARR